MTSVIGSNGAHGKKSFASVDTQMRHKNGVLYCQQATNQKNINLT